jgi:hypothetical protein
VYSKAICFIKSNLLYKKQFALKQTAFKANCFKANYFKANCFKANYFKANCFNKIALFGWRQVV